MSFRQHPPVICKQTWQSDGHNAIEDVGDQFSLLGIKPVTLDDHGQIKAFSKKIILSMVTGASHHASLRAKPRCHKMSGMLKDLPNFHSENCKGQKPIDWGVSLFQIRFQFLVQIFKDLPTHDQLKWPSSPPRSLVNSKTFFRLEAMVAPALPPQFFTERGTYRETLGRFQVG